MEANHKIKIVPCQSFDIPIEEMRNLYTCLALFHYRYIRVPDYNEKLLLQKLDDDMKKNLVEMQNLTEQLPNNYTLHKIRSFFDQHHRILNRIVKQ